MSTTTHMSVLHELQQQGAVAFGLEWAGGSLVGWTARLTVEGRCGDRSPFCVAASGASKQVAKQKAAGAVLFLFDNLTSGDQHHADCSTESGESSRSSPSSDKHTVSSASSQDRAFHTEQATGGLALPSVDYNNTVAAEDLYLPHRLLCAADEADKLGFIADLYNKGTSGMVVCLAVNSSTKCLSGLTEVGITILYGSHCAAEPENYVVAERQRCSRFFLPHRSEFLPMREVVKVIRDRMALAKDAGWGAVVGHTVLENMQWLETAGVDFTGLTICDIGLAQAHLDGVKRPRGLATAMETKGIWGIGGYDSAGNCAYDTARLFVHAVRQIGNRSAVLS